MKIIRNSILIALISAQTFLGCHPASAPDPTSTPPFKALSYTNTGLDFSNNLHPTPGFNVFDYMYFYNGGGIGAGDFNNDGLIDLFFTSNQEKNRLYLNTGS